MSGWSNDGSGTSGSSDSMGGSGSNNDYLSNTTGSNSSFRKVRRQHKALMQQNDSGNSGGNGSVPSSGNGTMKMAGTINNTKASSPEVTTGMKQFGAPKLNPLKRKMYKR
jgi:hypothetical protein